MKNLKQDLNTETLSEEFWARATSEEREQHIKLMLEKFQRKLTIFSNQSDQCFKNLGKNTTRQFWFKSAFICTSLALVVVNVLYSIYNKSFWQWPAPVLAALVAAASAIESQLKFSEKIETYRYLHRLFIGAINEFDHCWNTLVRPHAYSEKACINAQILVNNINAKDEELLKETMEEQNTLLREESK